MHLNLRVVPSAAGAFHFHPSGRQVSPGGAVRSALCDPSWGICLDGGLTDKHCAC